MFAKRLMKRRILHFVDNDAARDSIIGGYSRVAHSSALVSNFWLLEHRLECCSWFSRVPSFSNLSDGPSRGAFEEALRLGASRVEVDLPPWWHRCYESIAVV